MKLKATALAFAITFLLAIITQLDLTGSADTADDITITYISAGDSASFVVLSDGSLWGWGSNNLGQLGDGTTTNRYYPVKLMDNVVSVSTSYAYTLAIRTDGSLWMWGLGEDGICLDTFKAINIIPPHKIMEDVIYASTVNAHFAAITSDGSLWTWGANHFAQLGDGTQITRYDPVKIMEDVVAVSLGFSHTMAIKSDGSLWGWGSANGVDTPDGAPEPYAIDLVEPIIGVYKNPIKIMEDVIAVSAGASNTMAITSDNTLWAWGRDDFGIVSENGNDIHYIPPTQIMEDVIAISAGSRNPIVVQSDGSLWMWAEEKGDRFRDQLSPIFSESLPVPVNVLNDVVAISSNPNRIMTSHILALQVDGSLWSWGFNEYGQLGDGTTIARFTPAQVMIDIQ